MTEAERRHYVEESKHYMHWALCFAWFAVFAGALAIIEVFKTHWLRGITIDVCGVICYRIAKRLSDTATRYASKAYLDLRK